MPDIRIRSRLGCSRDPILLCVDLRGIIFLTLVMMNETGIISMV